MSSRGSSGCGNRETSWKKPGEKLYNLLLLWISTTRWRYNQGKCILVYNPHILCHTFKNLISTHSVNCAESRGKATPISACCFFFFFCKMTKTYFFELLPGDFSNLHGTWHTASVDPPDKKVIKRISIDHTILKLYYFPIGPWGPMQNFRRWPQGGAL